MNQRLIERTCSLGMAFVVTLAVLGGIDLMAQPEAGGMLWAVLHATTALLG